MTADNSSTSVSDSIFIIDWDNTLFGTTYLANEGFLCNSCFDHSKFQMNPEHQELIKDLNALEEVTCIA